MESWLTSTPYPGMILWIVLYISDYYMTLNSAKGFQEIGHFHFEGSFELTPQFQEDINKQKRISRRHIIFLVVYTLVILVAWWLFAKTLKAEWLYSIYLGTLILMEVAVHLRHFRNLHMVKAIKNEGGVEGDITYQKKLSYRISANEFQTFAWLFFIVAVITYSPFFLGGVISCFGISFRHNAYAKRAAGTPKAVHADHS
ncbi:MAG TPA: hypothetical protein PKE35_12290 [Anaerolineales bacterium]|nr:hypothetical protein [Anaerolineales bacterium]HNF35888.1 hypothetical protein [Anaerolineales bacterium]